MVSYKTLCVITATLSLVLSVVLLFIPALVLDLFGIESNASSDFISRRAAMLFLGMTLITWAMRNTVCSESRQAICLGLAITFMALAVLGTVEFYRGLAGAGVMFAVGTESIIAVLYFKHWSVNKVPTN